ncbi:MAG: VWA domain-containing protein [Planctomycetota bacterium]
MGFLLPQSFLGLLIIPLLFIVNLYRHKRIVVSVGSLIIWSRVKDKIEVQQSSRKKYINLMLILQICALLCLIFALAMPYFLVVSPLKQQIHIFFDISASMGATRSDALTRIEKAKKQATKLIESFSPNDSITITTIPQTAGYGFNQKITCKEAYEVIDSLLSTSLPVKDIEREVNKIVGNTGSNEEIFVFTDNAPVRKNSQFVYVSSTEEAENAGIIRFSVKKSLKSSSAYEVYTAVRNFGKNDINSDLRIESPSGKVLAEKKLFLQAGVTKEMFIEISMGDTAIRVIKASLSINDQLSIDNCAYATLKYDEEIHIGYLGKESPEIIKAVSQYQGIQITRLNKIPDSDKEYYDLIVINEADISKLPWSNRLIIAPQDEIQNLFSARGEVKVESITPLSTGGLFTDMSVMREISVAKSKHLVFSENMEIEELLKTKNSVESIPLICVLNHNKYKVIVISFSLLDSNWTRQISFPLFFALLLESVSTEANFAEVSKAFHSGELVPVKTGNLISISTPPGKILKIGNDCGLYYYLPLNEVGIYEIKRKQKNGSSVVVEQIGASLLNEKESDISGSASLTDSTEYRVIKKASVKKLVEIYPCFLLLAGVFMIIDWSISKRRKE